MEYLQNEQRRFEACVSQNNTSVIPEQFSSDSRASAIRYDTNQLLTNESVATEKVAETIHAAGYVKPDEYHRQVQQDRPSVDNDSNKMIGRVNAGYENVRVDPGYENWSADGSVTAKNLPTVHSGSHLSEEVPSNRRESQILNSAPFASDVKTKTQKSSTDNGAQALNAETNVSAISTNAETPPIYASLRDLRRNRASCGPETFLLAKMMSCAVSADEKKNIALAPSARPGPVRNTSVTNDMSRRDQSNLAQNLRAETGSVVQTKESISNTNLLPSRELRIQEQKFEQRQEQKQESGSRNVNSSLTSGIKSSDVTSRQTVERTLTLSPEVKNGNLTIDTGDENFNYPSLRAARTKSRQFESVNKLRQVYNAGDAQGTNSLQDKSGKYIPILVGSISGVKRNVNRAQSDWDLTRSASSVGSAEQAQPKTGPTQSASFVDYGQQNSSRLYSPRNTDQVKTKSSEMHNANNAGQVQQVSRSSSAGYVDQLKVEVTGEAFDWNLDQQHSRLLTHSSSHLDEIPKSVVSTRITGYINQLQQKSNSTHITSTMKEDEWQARLSPRAVNANEELQIELDLSPHSSHDSSEAQLNSPRSDTVKRLINSFISPDSKLNYKSNAITLLEKSDRDEPVSIKQGDKVSQMSPVRSNSFPNCNIRQINNDESHQFSVNSVNGRMPLNNLSSGISQAQSNVTQNVGTRAMNESQLELASLDNVKRLQSYFASTDLNSQIHSGTASGITAGKFVTSNIRQYEALPKLTITPNAREFNDVHEMSPRSPSIFVASIANNVQQMSSAIVRASWVNRTQFVPASTTTVRNNNQSEAHPVGVTSAVALTQAELPGSDNIKRFINLYTPNDSHSNTKINSNSFSGNAKRVPTMKDNRDDKEVNVNENQLKSSLTTGAIQSVPSLTLEGRKANQYECSPMSVGGGASAVNKMQSVSSSAGNVKGQSIRYISADARLDSVTNSNISSVKSRMISTASDNAVAHERQQSQPQSSYFKNATNKNQAKQISILPAQTRQSAQSSLNINAGIAIPVQEKSVSIHNTASANNVRGKIRTSHASGTNSSISMPASMRPSSTTNQADSLPSPSPGTSTVVETQSPSTASNNVKKLSSCYAASDPRMNSQNNTLPGKAARTSNVNDVQIAQVVHVNTGESKPYLTITDNGISDTQSLLSSAPVNCGVDESQSSSAGASGGAINDTETTDGAYLINVKKLSSLYGSGNSRLKSQIVSDTPSGRSNVNSTENNKRHAGLTHLNKALSKSFISISDNGVKQVQQNSSSISGTTGKNEAQLQATFTPGITNHNKIKSSTICSPGNVNRSQSVPSTTFVASSSSLAHTEIASTSRAASTKSDTKPMTPRSEVVKTMSSYYSSSGTPVNSQTYSNISSGKVNKNSTIENDGDNAKVKHVHVNAIPSKSSISLAASEAYTVQPKLSLSASPIEVNNAQSKASFTLRASESNQVQKKSSSTFGLSGVNRSQSLMPSEQFASGVHKSELDATSTGVVGAVIEEVQSEPSGHNKVKNLSNLYIPSNSRLKSQIPFHSPGEEVRVKSTANVAQDCRVENLNKFLSKSSVSLSTSPAIQIHQKSSLASSLRGLYNTQLPRASSAHQVQSNSSSTSNARINRPQSLVPSTTVMTNENQVQAIPSVTGLASDVKQAHSDVHLTGGASIVKRTQSESVRTTSSIRLLRNNYSQVFVNPRIDLNISSSKPKEQSLVIDNSNGKVLHNSKDQPNSSSTTRSVLAKEQPMLTSSNQVQSKVGSIPSAGDKSAVQSGQSLIRPSNNIVIREQPKSAPVDNVKRLSGLFSISDSSRSNTQTNSKISSGEDQRNSGLKQDARETQLNEELQSKSTSTPVLGEVKQVLGNSASTPAVGETKQIQSKPALTVTASGGASKVQPQSSLTISPSVAIGIRPVSFATDDDCKAAHTFQPESTQTDNQNNNVMNITSKVARLSSENNFDAPANQAERNSGANFRQEGIVTSNQSVQSPPPPPPVLPDANFFIEQKAASRDVLQSQTCTQSTAKSQNGSSSASPKIVGLDFSELQRVIAKRREGEVVVTSEDVALLSSGRSELDRTTSINNGEPVITGAGGTIDRASTLGRAAPIPSHAPTTINATFTMAQITAAKALLKRTDSGLPSPLDSLETMFIPPAESPTVPKSNAGPSSDKQSTKNSPSSDPSVGLLLGGIPTPPPPPPPAPPLNGGMMSTSSVKYAVIQPESRSAATGGKSLTKQQNLSSDSREGLMFEIRNAAGGQGLRKVCKMPIFFTNFKINDFQLRLFRLFY